jgi:hypothetical protein
MTVVTEKAITEYLGCARNAAQQKAGFPACLYQDL